MEHAETPVVFALAGRPLRLLFNARAWRLIKEHAGISILSGKFDGMQFTEQLPRVLWAAAQNEGNGKAEDWPAFEWVEEHLCLADLDAVAMAITKLLPVGERGNGAANPLLAPTTELQPPGPEIPIQSGSISGPSEPST